MAELTTNYYNGQGKVFIAEVVNGVTQAYKWLGNVTALSLSTEVEKKEHKESYTGNRTTDKVIYTGKTCTYSIAMEEITTENLQRAFQGTVQTVATGSVTDEDLGTVVQGDLKPLARQKVSDVVITDSVGTALEADKNYVVNEVFGSIEFLDLDVDGLTAPLSAKYNYGAVDKVKFLDAPAKEYAYRFEGLNTAEGNRPVLVEIFKSSLDPAQTFDLINEDFATLEVEGEALSTSKGLVEVTLL